MCIVACFVTETRKTIATSDATVTLAKSSRRDNAVRKKTMPAVTAVAKQKRTAIGSVRNRKTKVAASNPSAPAIGAIRAALSPSTLTHM